MTTRDLWYGTDGPKDAPIVLVGESWGLEELNAKRPFMGTSGTELNRILAEAGVSRNEILCTNVVAEKPAANETWRFFEPKLGREKSPRLRGLLPSALIRDECRRLYQQINAFPRRVVIATGNYAFWALSSCTGSTVIRESNNRPVPPELQTHIPSGIMDWRGSMWFCEPEPSFGTLPKNLPLLPIIHPASIMRQWSLRSVTVHDLKARVPMALRGDWRPNPAPVFWAPPTFAQARSRLRMWLDRAAAGTEVYLLEDIETARGVITCLGLSDSPNFAMSIPFIRRTDSGFDSWWSESEEVEIVRLLRAVNSHPRIHIWGQNFIYDTQYIQHWLGVTPKLDFDSMLCQNVVFPGTPKDLGYLSSLFCRYHWYWKEDHKEWNLSGTIEDLLLYNCMDCVRNWEVCESQREMLTKVNLWPQMEFKMRTNDLCLRMMNRGVLIDRNKRATLQSELIEALNGIYRELLQIIPQTMVDPDFEANYAKAMRSKSKKYVFWYTSDKQTKVVLHDILGMKKVLNRKTGNPTSGKEALMQLEKWYPEFTGLFRRLDQAGSIENTVNVIQTPLDPDMRMRCSFNPGGTETHRLSSSRNAFGRGTNLQNLTKGEEDD